MRDLETPWMVDPVTIFLEGHYWEITYDGQTVCNDADSDIVAAFAATRKLGKYESARLVVTPYDQCSCKVRFKGRVFLGNGEEGRLKWYEVIVSDQAVRDAVSAEDKRWERMSKDDDCFE